MDNTPKRIDTADLLVPLWIDVIELKAELRLLRQALKEHGIDLGDKFTKDAMVAEMRKELEKQQDREDSRNAVATIALKSLDGAAQELEP